jgi:uncharacterized protein
MSLFISLLPVYLLGNLHCMGMCGPLVMFIGRHRFRNAYFLGRIVAFSLAGMIAGEIGAVLQLIFNKFHIPAITSFLFGGFLILMAISYLAGIRYSGAFFSSLLGEWSKKAAMLLTKDQFYSVFLFGLCTVLLPCGQSLMVFSACALSGDALVGGINGFAFALLTSPSLWFAMKAQALLKACKRYYYPLLGIFSLIVGLLAICRGLAEIQWIPYWVLNPQSSSSLHIAIF